MGVRKWLATGLALGLAGCAATTPARAPAPGAISAVPEDFTLDVIVWNGRRRAAGADATPPEGDGAPAPGRYVVFCDGSLHWSPDGDPRQGLPPLRRVLAEGEMQRLWRLLVDLGMDDPDAAAPPINPLLLQPRSGELIRIAIITAGDRTWTHRSPVPADSGDRALAQLIGRLKELAWAGAAPSRPVAPRRYDFGPDPYARYRR